MQTNTNTLVVSDRLSLLQSDRSVPHGPDEQTEAVGAEMACRFGPGAHIGLTS